MIEDLKASAPAEPRKGGRRPKLEQVHLNLIARLECRVEAIDAELAVSFARSLNFDFFFFSWFLVLGGRSVFVHVLTCFGYG